MKKILLFFLGLFCLWGVQTQAQNGSAGLDIMVLCTPPCSPEVFLSASDQLSGEWQLVSGAGKIEDPSSPTTKVTDLALGNNYFVWKTVQEIDTVNVRYEYVFQPPSDGDGTWNSLNPSQTTIAGSDQTICSNTTSLAASANVAGIWSVASGQAVIDNPTLYNTTVSIYLGTAKLVWNTGTTDTVQITNARVTAAAGADQAVCNDMASLTAAALAPDETGLWTSASGFITFSNPNSAVTNVLGLQQGANSFMWTVSNQYCNDVDEVIVENMHFEAYAGPDQVTDVNNTTLGASHPNGMFGEWTLESGNGQFNNSFDATTSVIDLGVGINEFRWTLQANGCEAHDIVRVTYNALQPNAGNDLNICTNATQLQAQEPIIVSGGLVVGMADGTWSVAKGSADFSDIHLYNTQVFNLSEGENKLVWTICKNGFCATDTVRVNVTFPVAIAGADQSVCASTIMLTANQPLFGAGKWSVVEGNATFFNVTLHSTSVGLSPDVNVLRWTVTSYGCSTFDEVVITNKTPSFAIAGTDQTVCSNMVLLSASTPVVGVGEWSSQTGTFADVNKPNTTVALQQGTNTLTWTISSYCGTTSSTIVLVNKSVSADAGQNINVCADTAVLAATQALNGSGVWSVIGSSATATFENPTMHNTIVRNLNIGFNTLRWTVVSECDAVSDEVIVTNETPSSADAGFDNFVCGATATLQGNNPVVGTGNWSTFGSATFVNSNNPNTEVGNLQAGMNSLTWTISSVCGIKSDNVNITNGTPNPANAGADQVLCGTQAMLSANSPKAGINAIGTWTTLGGAIFADAHNALTTVSNLDKGQNVLTWTIQNGCGATYDMVTVVNNLPSAIVVDTMRICSSSTQLMGNVPLSGETGKWTVLSGTAVLANPSLFNTSVSNISTGSSKLRWTITRGDCATSADLVILNNSFNVQAGADQFGCTDMVQMSGSDPLTGIGRWSVETGFGTIVSPTSKNTTIKDIGRGKNTFRWSVTYKGCTASDTVSVTNQLPSEASAMDDANICSDTYTLVANEPEFGTGKWTLESGNGNIVLPSNPTTLVTGLKGLNIFRWTITNGNCTVFDDVTVTNETVSSKAGLDQVLCGDSAQMSAVAPANGTQGLWKIRGGYGEFDNPTLYNTMVRNLGEGKNSFVWLVTNTNSGCSGSDEVSITNNAAAKAVVGIDDTICVNSYKLLANDPSPGVGTWSVMTGGGVFANQFDFNTTVSNIGVGRNIYRWTIVKGSCSSYDDISIVNNTVDAIAGADKAVCGTSASLSGNNPFPENGFWSLVSGEGVIDDDTKYNTTVRNLGSGTNTFRWFVNRNNCTAFDDITIANNYHTANAGEDVTTCEEQVQLTANMPADNTIIGYWQRVGGVGTIVDTADYATMVTNLGVGTSRFRWNIVKDGCISFDEVTVISLDVDAIAPSNDVICADSYTLVANSAGSGIGLWTNVGGSAIIANPNSNITEVIGLNEGSNTFRWTIKQDGCVDYSDVIITNASFQVSAGVDLNVCDINTVMNATRPLPGQTGYWTIEGGSGVLVNPTLNNTKVTNLNNGANMFRWTVIGSQCQASDVVIINNNKYEAEAGAMQTLCIDSTQLAGINPVIGSGEWSVVLGAGQFRNKNSASSMVGNIATGTNVFRWTITTANCTSHDDVTIVNNSVKAMAGENQSLCVADAVMSANKLPDGATGVWTVENGGGFFVSDTQFNTTVKNLQQGANTYRWTVLYNDCITSDVVQIENNSFETYAGADQVVNVNNTTLMASYPTGMVGQWTLVRGKGAFNNPFDATTQVIDLGTGINEFRWTLKANGCEASDIVRVTYNALYPVAGADMQLCGDSTVLQAEPPLIMVGGVIVGVADGKWTVASGRAVFEDAADNDTKVHNLMRGQNILVWTICKNGFCASDTVVLYNNQFDVTAGQDYVGCDNFMQLDATNPGLNGSGSWSLGEASGGQFDDLTNPKTIVRNLARDVDNQLIWTVNRGGCLCSDTVILRALKIPVAQFETSNTFGCSPLEVEFRNTSLDDNRAFWRFGDNTLKLTDTVQQFTHTYYNGSQQTGDTANYEVTMVAYSRHLIGSIDFLCPDTATKKIIRVQPQPYVDFQVTPEYLVFPSSTVQLQNNSNNGYDSYFWTFGDNTSNDQQNPGSHTYAAQGSQANNYEYVITLVGRLGQCTDTAMHTIRILPTGVEEKMMLDINMFPNPANDKVQITGHFTEPTRLQIISADGKVWHQEQLAQGEVNHSIDCSALSVGLYLVKFTDSQQTSTYKLVID